MAMALEAEGRPSGVAVARVDYGPPTAWAEWRLAISTPCG